MHVAYRPEDLVAIVAAERTAGATTAIIRDIASLGSARAGDLSFLGNKKYRAEVAATKASVVLVPMDYEGEPQADQFFLFVTNPSAALALVCARIEQSLWPRPPAGVHPTAFVAPGARISPGATIGPLCVIEEEAVIGAGTVLHASVQVGRGAQIGENCLILAGCIIGAACELRDRVRLQPGVVIGSDGFGYEFVDGRHEKVPQIGIVVVENDVEIGANSTIDRARFSRTVIGEGTKIDNLVQVGHNVVIGKHCILCAQVAIAGSATLEDYVVLGGQAAVAGHITVRKGTKAGGQTGIAFDTEPGSYLNGTPARPYMLDRRIEVLRQKLPELFKRVGFLEAELKKTSESAD
ncbi:MAG: UDP-3-O-(3-hydroxymyristoyl)glucosamine N-acyltransferase [Candidatus Didemnitutus sp.]|nr:UDP-3-O-(3-hydroxymyristoyl)glucosamine N-acyltransferase [Candidatus Didemnitutus sp.]